MKQLALFPFICQCGGEYESANRKSDITLYICYKCMSIINIYKDEGADI
jgi:predicted SprT family Zn-dependent metalloprotease